ncbi:nitroreductase [Natronosporangium hydrolyticum]|uniref:Nitroreductase n=1 Tax=Natronosporangium hydrolyticum TaxID=2811111 RepID=A0A895YS94_9ACTN|nr:nitroreductase [Natronosporangium hydrolyticum]QSB16888.1 nitroreductase [Natronosporangium hydrolyticum]
MTTDNPTAPQLAEAARAAGLAPSVHNTQPWRWLVHPDHLELYADRSRQLPVADPEGRLLTISCGAALHHAQVALAAEGWRSTVTPLPDPAQPDLLARVIPTTATEDPNAALRRFQAAQRRHTDRRAVTDQPVPPTALAQIRAAVEEYGLNLHVFRPEQLSELAVAADRAERQAASQPELLAELAYWTGGQQPAGTGIPDRAIPSEPPHTHVPVRDFGHPGELAPGAGTDRAASYAVLFGAEDTPASWLRAGQAAAAGWLTATEQGVAVLPFSAIVEAPGTRAVLRHLLAELGQPYLVLRLGLADPDHPGPAPTDRLAAAQTVEIVGGDQ